MLENKVYPKLRDYIKEHHGWSGEELKQTEVYKEYLAFMEILATLDKKKVKLTYTYSNDWQNGQKETIGRIVIDSQNRLCFMEGKARTRGKYLDAGLYEGWFATIIPLRIETI